MSEFSPSILVFIFCAVILLSNWISGFILINFLAPRYETTESADYLNAYGFKLIKFIRPTKNYQSQSAVLKDSRSGFKKVYSNRRLHLLIVYDNEEKKNRLLWVELLQSWNVSHAKRRIINYHLETNQKLTTTITTKLE